MLCAFSLIFVENLVLTPSVHKWEDLVSENSGNSAKVIQHSNSGPGIQFWFLIAYVSEF